MWRWDLGGTLPDLSVVNGVRHAHVIDVYRDKHIERAVTDHLVGVGHLVGVPDRDWVAQHRIDALPADIVHIRGAYR